MIHCRQLPAVSVLLAACLVAVWAGYALAAAINKAGT